MTSIASLASVATNYNTMLQNIKSDTQFQELKTAKKNFKKSIIELCNKDLPMKTLLEKVEIQFGNQVVKKLNEEGKKLNLDFNRSSKGINLPSSFITAASNLKEKQTKIKNNLNYQIFRAAKKDYRKATEAVLKNGSSPESLISDLIALDAKLVNVTHKISYWNLKK